MRSLDISIQYSKIIEFIKNYFDHAKLDYILLGLSGGIDSALCACVASAAVGNNKVLGILMPSSVSSSSSLTDAKQLAQNLQIETLKVPINPIYNAFVKAIDMSDLAKENVQARIRGTLLMSLANTKNGLVIATGNKSEIYAGYFTLYGDSVGAIAPISHLYKCEVYALANFINEKAVQDGKTPPIPQNSIAKAPSAELTLGQKDCDSLPEYEELDPILECLVDQGLSIDQTVAQGFSKDVVLQVYNLIEKSAFKRVGLALGISD